MFTVITKIMFSENIIGESIYHCRTRLAIKTFSYIWNIDDFWEVYKYATEVYSTKVESHLRFYMSIEKDNLKFHILIDESTSKNFSGSYFIFLKTNEEDIMYVSKSTHKLYNEEILCELPTSDIEKYLSDETFTICFKFHVFHDLINYDICHTHCPTKFIINDFVHDDKYDSFVTFVIKQKSLQISKQLLCLNSKVFEIILCCGPKNEVDNKIEVTDMSYDTVKELLSFIENGYLSEKIKTDAVALHELYLAADKYEIKNLKSVCEKYLIMTTTVKNIIEHLEVTCLDNSSILQKYAIQFIQLYLKEIKNIPDFKLLMKTYPDLLTRIQNDAINISTATI